jgi:hypothetical protein
VKPEMIDKESNHTTPQGMNGNVVFMTSKYVDEK